MYDRQTRATAGSRRDGISRDLLRGPRAGAAPAADRLSDAGSRAPALHRYTGRGGDGPTALTVSVYSAAAVPADDLAYGGDSGIADTLTSTDARAVGKNGRL